MLTLLHGDNIVDSRNELVRIKNNYQGEVLIFNGKTLSLTELKSAVESLSLFGSRRLIIIEELHSKISKIQLKELLEYLLKSEISVDMILWESKEILKTSLNKFMPVWKIQLFSIPKSLFTLLSSIIPSNNAKIMKLLKETRKTNNNEFIFLMIVRQIKMLLLASENALTSMPTWMQFKYLRQAKDFSKEQLLRIYRKLLLIDIGQKTSRSPFTLAQELDLFLATL